jgi:hypothetical protein
MRIVFARRHYSKKRNSYCPTLFSFSAYASLTFATMCRFMVSLKHQKASLSAVF